MPPESRRSAGLLPVWTHRIWAIHVWAQCVWTKRIWTHHASVRDFDFLGKGCSSHEDGFFCAELWKTYVGSGPGLGRVVFGTRGPAWLVSVRRDSSLSEGQRVSGCYATYPDGLLFS